MQNYVSSTSSHLHLCTSIFSPISLLIFTFTFTTAHRHLCSSSSSHIYIFAHVHICTSTSLLIFTPSHLHLTSLPRIYISHLHLSLFLTFSLKAGGSSAAEPDTATQLLIPETRRYCIRNCLASFGWFVGGCWFVWFWFVCFGPFLARDSFTSSAR